MNSNNSLEVLIAGVKLTPRVKDVSKFEGHRRVNWENLLYKKHGLDMQHKPVTDSKKHHHNPVHTEAHTSVKENNC